MIGRLASIWVWLGEVIIVAALSAVAIYTYTNPTLHTDESYHLLCSISLNHGEGLPIIGDYPYTRAWVFSYLVAWSQGLFGFNLTAARLPAVIAAVLMVAVLFTWVRYRAGRTAGWAAALLLGLSVHTPDIAQFCRFYTLHALMVLLASIGVFEALAPGLRLWRRFTWLLLALPALGLAWHLQVTTAVAVAGLGTWVGLVAVWSLWTTPRLTGRTKLLSLTGLGVAAAATIGGLVASGMWDWGLRHLSWTPYWAGEHRRGVFDYHSRFAPWYQGMWYLTPLALVLALPRHARMALFCAVTLVVSLVMMSLSSVHALRYVFFCTPMWFTIWGLATATVCLFIYRTAVAWGDARFTLPTARATWRAMCILGLVLACLAAAYKTPAYWRTWRNLRHAEGDALAPWGDYESALAAIHRTQPELLDVPVILASPAAKARYFFPSKRVYLLGKSDSPDLSRDIVDAQSLAQFVAEHEQGMIIVDQKARFWRDPRFVTDEMADFIESSMIRLPTPKGAGVVLYRWDRDVDGQQSAADQGPGDP